MIRILFFASIRDRLGVAETSIDTVPATVGDLREQLAARGAEWADVLGTDNQVLAAVNQAMSGPDAGLADGDEVGFFPPVTGG
jgi:molybdopterin synthase sulfur carrier subunit